MIKWFIGLLGATYEPLQVGSIVSTKWGPGRVTGGSVNVDLLSGRPEKAAKNAIRVNVSVNLDSLVK